MSSATMSKIEFISKNNEALYVTLIENYGLTFALPFLKVIDSVRYLTMDEKIEASKLYLASVGRIVEQNFVHSDGHTVEVSSGYNDDMGFFIEARCWECDVSDCHCSKSLGLKDGKPVDRVRRNWHGLKRKVVTL
ncbi:hypothetical protein M2277_006511 [Paenibacillus sp. LBL]|uniref:hypothetical protein n=1 Tax=unclassified Paenibacillus TaxID=185978 RepID=UPI00247399FD|nr:hypothetical protein [Paenibacillus sp. LBL]MDH6675790.1 hypothetical protein [Paenibacillus sp. LBL]